MKTIFLSGRLTSDPTVTEAGEKNTKLAKFTLANNDAGKDSPAEYFDVHCWDSLAELTENNLKKGNKIIVQGSFSNAPYTDKEGAKKTHFEITAKKIEFAD